MTSLSPTDAERLRSAFLRCRDMGHETVGEVLAFGPDVKPTDQGDLKLGDVGLVYPWIGCGKCATCLAGDENMDL